MWWGALGFLRFNCLVGVTPPFLMRRSPIWKARWSSILSRGVDRWGRCDAGARTLSEVRLLVAYFALIGIVAVAGCGSDTEDVARKSQGSGGLGGSSGGSGTAGVGGLDAGGGLGATGGVAGNTDAGQDADDASSEAGSDGAPDAADAGCTLTDTSQYPAMIASAMCGLHESCCTEAGLSFTLSACLIEAEADLKLFANHALCDGGVWDPANVAKCIAATESFGCLGETNVKVDVWQSACAEILVGTPNPGSDCVGNPDCFAGAGVQSCIDGKCAVGSLAAVGQACSPKLDPTTPKQVCDETLQVKCVNGVCVSAAEEGMPCGQVPCADGLSCISSTCVPDLQPGADCAPFTGPVCALGSTCIAGKCAGLVGDICTLNPDCAQNSCLNGTCAPSKPWPLGLVGNAACF
jgi:hypothetical protein